MGSSMWIEGNERLKPEVSNQFNGGVGYRFGPALELSIESFYNSLTNMIVLHSVLDESGSAVFIDGLPLHSYVNADEGYAWGVSPGVSFSPALWMSVSCNVSIVRSFAQNKNGIMREKENYTPNALALKIHASLEKIRGFLPSVSAGVVWKDEQITGYDTAGDPLYNDSFTKVNVQLSKSILEGLTLRLGANNLLDYTRPGHDGIEYGRTYTASVDMNIDNIMKIGESLHPKLF
jgi:outer membrane receptor protein involved in Fe transport